MTTTSAKETVFLLRLHNAWRRGDDESLQMIEPKMLGAAIDSAILLIEQRDELISAANRCLKMLMSEPDTKGALFKAENILRETIAQAKGG